MSSPRSFTISRADMNRRLPPYTTQLRKRLGNRDTWHSWFGTSSDGENVTLFLICGSDAWSWASKWINSRLFVVLPPEDAPEAYDWSILSGHPPVLIYRAGHVHPEIVDRLAAAAIRCGVERLLLMGTGGVRYLTDQEAA